MYRGKYGRFGMPNGYKGDWAAAITPHVQAALKAHAGKVYAKASAILTAHRDTGMSYILMEHGDIDYHVILGDETKPPRVGYIEGEVAPLRRAANLPFTPKGRHRMGGRRRRRTPLRRSRLGGMSRRRRRR